MEEVKQATSLRKIFIISFFFTVLLFALVATSFSANASTTDPKTETPQLWNLTSANGTFQKVNHSMICYTSLQKMPVTCEGGVITEDMWDGCRHITCAKDNSSMKVLACNKPDFGKPEYFEMYKQQDADALEICIGTTCISTNWYARSPDFPICPNTPSATLKIAPYYPKDREYVFICDVQGFTPNSYDWVFGDGHKLWDLPEDDVYHVYENPGNHTVSCTATDGDIFVSDSLDIEVI